MPASNTSPRRGWKLFSLASLGYLLIFLVVATIISLWATLWFGGVEGTEFSAESFNRREFEYFRLPFVGMQVTGLDRTVSTSPTEQFLLSKGYVVPIQPEKWDLIRGTQSNMVVDPRGASILCAYLDAKDQSSQPLWLAWSRDHPQLAAILWPQVVAVARMRRYEMVPDMMRLAQLADETQPSQFQNELNTLVADESVRLAKWLEKIDAKQARDLYQLALSNVPGHAGAQQGLNALTQ